jgi:hypothetical protein
VGVGVEGDANTRVAQPLTHRLWVGSGSITPTDKKPTSQEEEYADPTWALHNYGACFYSTATGQSVSAEYFAWSYKWRLLGVPHHSFYNFF